MSEKGVVKAHTTEVFEKNLAARAQTVINRGGARSSKSYSLAQLLIMKLNNEENKVIGICRKTMPALRMTAYRLFIDLLKEYGRYSVEYHNRSENRYDWGKNRVYFFSIDDPEKIRSTEFNYIWMEEAAEFTLDDYMTLKLRLSGKTTSNERNQIFLSFNPSDSNSWIRTKLLQMDDVEEIHSTYKDNPFLPKDYIKTIEKLKEQDKMYHKIYALGEWGFLENKIYTNYQVITDMDYDRFQGGETIYGLDFGFNNPTVLVEIKIGKEDAFIRQKIYDTGLTTPEIIAKMEARVVDRRKFIFADSEDPKTIEEIYRAGFNIIPAEKGQDSVRNGIDIVKRFKLKLSNDSPDVIKEIENYCWKKDKNGNLIDEPVKFNDHAMDAIRYAIAGYYSKVMKNQNEWVFARI